MDVAETRICDVVEPTFRDRIAIWKGLPNFVPETYEGKSNSTEPAFI